MSRFLRVTTLSMMYRNSCVSEFREYAALINTERIESMTQRRISTVEGNNLNYVSVVTDKDTHNVLGMLHEIESQLDRIAPANAASPSSEAS